MKNLLREVYGLLRRRDKRLACTFSLVLADRTLMFRISPFRARRLVVKRWPVPVCAECGEPDVESYMVRDDVWNLVATREEFLHADCLAKRLGRPLTIRDFTECDINSGVFMGYWLRLNEMRLNATTRSTAPYGVFGL